MHNVAIRQVRHIAYVTAGEELIQGSGARHRQRIPYECGSDFTARLATGPVPACANAKPDALKPRLASYERNFVTVSEENDSSSGVS